MFDLTRSSWSDLRERPLPPLSPDIEEGSVLVYGSNGAGTMAVGLGTGVVSDIFAGWALTDNVNFLSEVKTVDFIAPVLNPTFQFVDTVAEQILGGGVYDYSAYLVGAGGVLSPAGASTVSPGIAPATSQIAFAGGTVTAGAKVRIVYRHTLSQQEAKVKYHQRPVNNRAQQTFGLVSVMCGEGEIFTSQYDVTVTYAVKDKLYVSATPGRVTNVSPGAGADVVGIVSQIPTANSQQLLGVKWNVKQLE
jgi:hypothetical protein